MTDLIRVTEKRVWPYMIARVPSDDGWGGAISAWVWECEATYLADLEELKISLGRLYADYLVAWFAARSSDILTHETCGDFEYWPEEGKFRPTNDLQRAHHALRLAWSCPEMHAAASERFVPACPDVGDILSDRSLSD